MKTNHKRGFKARCDSYKKYSRYIVWSRCTAGPNRTPVSNKLIGAGSTLGSESSRGVARATHGAKKYLRSRTRFHENAATKKLMYEDFD